MDNLNSALEIWNGKLAEIWTLLSTSPEIFRGGGVWSVILNINDALKAIGYALVVLFFVVGVVKTCGSFTELKKPEAAFKCFVRFALAQAAVTYGMELLMALIQIAQGAVSTIMGAAGLTSMTTTALPDEMVAIIEDVGFWESIPLWAVTLLGSLLIWTLSLVMILTVYYRKEEASWNKQLRNGLFDVFPLRSPGHLREEMDSTASSGWRPTAASAPTARSRSTATLPKKRTTAKKLRRPRIGRWLVCSLMRGSREPA